jgi:hypothetical protein
MSKIILTVDEIVAYLKKSNLTNILVEGPDDLMVHNWIEEKINSLNITIFPCGGRSTLIEVYNRRREFADKKVTYVADMDLYAFTGVPQNLSEIIFTSGYSIENDLYAFGKSTIDNLFNTKELEEFNETMNNLVPWYCSEILKYLNGQEHHISFHLNRIVAENTTVINPSYISTIQVLSVTDEFIEQVKENNFLKLRGKFIFDCIVRHLSHRSRRSKFSKENIMELCLRMNRNNHFERIIEEINHKLSA